MLFILIVQMINKYFTADIWWYKSIVTQLFNIYYRSRLRFVYQIYWIILEFMQLYLQIIKCHHIYFFRFSTPYIIVNLVFKFIVAFATYTRIHKYRKSFMKINTLIFQILQHILMCINFITFIRLWWHFNNITTTWSNNVLLLIIKPFNSTDILLSECVFILQQMTSERLLQPEPLWVRRVYQPLQHKTISPKRV